MRAAGELGGFSLPFDQATVILHYHFKTKTRRDPDNYSGKMIMDALKENAFITDDSFKEIDIYPMADFGQTKMDSVEIFIFQGKQLEGIVRKLIKGEQMF